jgi:hypothetical protein
MRLRVTEARTLVLIDDEATTGNTFINLLAHCKYWPVATAGAGCGCHAHRLEW